MNRRTILIGIAALALLTGAASAQEAGGLGVSGPGLGQMHQGRPAQDGAGVAGPLARAPADVKAANPARAREEVAQQAIASIRGDAGYLAGFHFGQPLAASRQPPPDFGPPLDLTVIEAPFIVNSQDSVVNLAVGDGNSTQQAAASGSASPAAGTGVVSGSAR